MAAAGGSLTATPVVSCTDMYYFKVTVALGCTCTLMNIPVIKRYTYLEVLQLSGIFNDVIET